MQTDIRPSTSAPRLSWNGSAPRVLTLRPPSPFSTQQPAVKRALKQITTVNHQGTVIVFGRDATGSSTDIYYNVLDLKVTTLSDDQEWTGFNKLAFPDELRPAGLGIVTLDDPKGSVLSAADAPFQALSDGQYVCLFQQSSRNTLMLSRFMLKRVAAAAGQQPAPVLEPVWEVRFQRSGKQDVPSGDKDSQNYLAPDGTPFIEPMIELPMIENLSGGSFSAVILPNQGGTEKNWQFLAVDNVAGTLNLFRFPMDSVGLFDLSTQRVDENGNVVPDASISLAYSDGKTSEALTYAGVPASTMYTLNERVNSTNGDSLLLKRTARVLASLPVTRKDGSLHIATLDFGVSKDGTLAKIADQTTVTAVDPADYGLQFNATAYVSLPNNQSSLSLKGSFRTEFWLYLTSAVTSDQYVFQGAAGVDPKSAAPYVKITSGLQVAAGFGDGTNAVMATTAQPVVAPMQWVHVVVDFDSSKASGNFSVVINGNTVPVQGADVKSVPSGNPITTVSGQSNGVIGILDLLKIWNTSSGTDNLVGDWEFNTITYVGIDAVTPDSSPYKNDGSVYGAILVPSSAPSAPEASGAMQIDDDGLVTYCGLLSFVSPKGSPSLMTGSDGLVHMYFEGADGSFSVAQFDAETARAIFAARWMAKTADSTIEGDVQFTAARAGTYMNASSIVVAPDAHPELCTLTFDNRQGRVETYTGVPRALSPLMNIVNGASTDNVNDPGVAAGTATFYDNNAAYAMSRVAIADQDPAYATFLSRYAPSIQLGSVQITADAQYSNVALTYTIAQWGTAKTITQTWAKLPVYARDAFVVLGGTSNAYDYSSTTSSNAGAYHVIALDSSNGRHYPIFFTRPGVTNLTIAITAGTTAQTCNVALSYTVDGGTKNPTFNDVARDQNTFATLFNTSATATDLLLITDGLTAMLQNRAQGAADASDMHAWASILCTFTDTTISTTATMVAQGPIAAAAFQKSSYTDSTGTHPLENGSGLFRVSPVSSPSNGGIAQIEDTAQFTGGNANLVTAAVNGGWLQETPHKAIRTKGGNGVSVDQAAVTAEPLAIAGDCSIEAWCRPSVGVGGATNQPRIFSYQRVGNAQFPTERIQYALGLAPAPSAVFGDSTAIYGSYNLPTPDCSMQVWVNPSSVNQGQLLQIYTTGVIEAYLTLSIDASGSPVATYGKGVGTVQGTTLPRNAWTQLTVTLQKLPSSSNVRLTLYVNGASVGTGDFAYTAPTRVVGGFAAGSTTGSYQAAVNGVMMWNYALDADHVAQSYEQTTPTNAQGLVVAWYLIDGSGDTIINRALEGSPFISKIMNQPQTPWLPSGVYYRPWASNRGYGLISTDTPVLGGWAQVASTYRSAYALHFTGADYVNCGHDSSLDFDNTFSTECWIKPDVAGVVQTLISKPGNYEVSLNYDNTVVLTVWTSVGTIRVQSKDKVQAGQPFYLATTATTSVKKPDSGSQQPQQQTYLVDINVYVNGKLSGSFYKDDYTDSVSFSTSTDDFNLARNSKDAAYYTGYLSDVRVWNTVLAPTAIAGTFLTHLPSSGNGMISYWRFAEMTGKYAYDQTNLNNGIITSNELWTLFPPASALSLLVDGVVQNATVVDPATLGGYGAEQLSIGVLKGDSGAFVQPFYGDLCEVRLWNIQLTAEQVQENMYRQLASNETGLMGYWPMGAGSGSIAEDATGRGNDGVFSPSTNPPVWVNSTVPVGNESPTVYNVLGGIMTPFVYEIEGIPSVVEYADTRRDAYGALFSVMKRCYASEFMQIAQLDAGFTVGDLDTVYAGQVQTQPSLIGYIEGAPPIPSENQTNPWWDDVNYINTYADNTKISLEQEQETKYVFSGSENTGSGSSVEGKVGVFLATGSSLSFGLGEEVGWETYKLEGHLGYKGESKSDTKAEQELGFGFGKKASQADELAAGGEWEPADKILNPEVGRRYVPENVGYALVKSMTADMYLVKLRNSSTVVKITLVPDPDIPEDVNIINFPIDPTYTKNGTLDGMVGFKNDPYFPYASVQPSSYFRPIEAYNMKRAIERQDKSLEAYYQQFSTSNYSQGNQITVKDGTLAVTNGFDRFRDSELATDKSYDWQQQLAKRSICNTYVWTSQGGLHAEQTELVDSYKESYNGVSGYDSSDGVVFDLEAAFVAGVYGDFDALWSTSLEVKSVKEKESEASFGLKVEFSPDRYLKRPVVDASGKPVGYTEDDAPGKVSGYRFMSFYIAPSNDNFVEFQRVVDQNWLNNSTDPNAAALLTATSAANGAWRVLHRVTYVSRIPPVLQPAPAQTIPEPIVPPANEANNTIIVRMIEKQISVPNPSAAQIGQAVTKTLGTSPSDPGLISNVLLWWPSFLQQAQDTRSDAYMELTQLRTDLLDYMVQTYAAQQQLQGNAFVGQLRSLHS